jgi:hypothetical protein
MQFSCHDLSTTLSKQVMDMRDVFSPRLVINVSKFMVVVLLFCPLGSLNCCENAGHDSSDDLEFGFVEVKWFGPRNAFRPLIAAKSCVSDDLNEHSKIANRPKSHKSRLFKNQYQFSCSFSYRGSADREPTRISRPSVKGYFRTNRSRIATVRARMIMF